MKQIFTFIAIILLASKSLLAQNPVLNLTLFSSGYNSPVDITNCGDSRMFIVDENGYIYICDSVGNKNPSPFLDIHTEVTWGGEQGLLGMAFHPDYVNNGFFFVDYTDNSGGDTRISRFQVDGGNPNHASASSEVILKEIDQPYSNHNGGCLRFGPDGYLYIGMGDGGSGGDPQNHAQNTNDLLGKMLRIDVNATTYSIPASNPFVGNSSYAPEIWAVGMRNPWRFSFDKLTGDLWIGDVGQYIWEEVDLELAGDPGGHNYGWRCYEANHPFNTSGCAGISNYDFPIAEYQHNNGDAVIVGGIRYRGPEYANMYGKYFYTDNYSGRFRFIEPNGSGGWTQSVIGVYDTYDYAGFGEDRYNRLYVAGVSSGNIFKVEDTSCTPVAVIEQGDSIYLCGGDQVTLSTPYGPDLVYQWQLNAGNIAGATDDFYTTSQAGNYSVHVANTSGCSNNSVTSVILTSISFSISIDTFCTSDPPYTLSAVPSGGTFTGAGVSTNQFDASGLAEGNYQIIYSYTDSSGCAASDTELVNVQVCAGIQELLQSHLTVVPNPSDGEIMIQLFGVSSNISEVKLHDLIGKEVFSETNFNLPNNSTIMIQNKSLPKGVYMLSVKAGDKTLRGKVVIE